MPKKVLHLTVKKKWFDLIAAGKKKTEFREGKEYWRKRMLNEDGFAIEFDEVLFKNGYGTVPFARVEWKDLGIIPKEGWEGEHGETAKENDFAIILGKVLEVSKDGMSSIEYAEVKSLSNQKVAFMDRQHAIDIIEQLYPADSGYDSTRETGENLLNAARAEVSNWRDESDAVLIRYAELCLEKEGKN